MNNRMQSSPANANTAGETQPAPSLADEETLTLDKESVIAIRHALIIGLQSYGEIERLCDNAHIMEMTGNPIPESWRPSHPTGSNETIGQFADALAYLNRI